MHRIHKFQNWALRFHDSDLEHLYLDARFKSLSAPLVLSLIIVSNLLILIFLLVRVLKDFEEETSEMGKCTVSLIIFCSTLLAEAVLLVLPAVRWLRGVLYITVISFIFHDLAGTEVYNYE